MVKFRSTKVTRKEDDGIYSKLTLDSAEIDYLIEQLLAVRNERGVHLCISTKKKINSNTGVAFDSSVAFIQEVKDVPGSGAARTTAPASAAPASVNKAQEYVDRVRQQRRS
jgi:hypothetical protein